jgi:predicted MFS family arabinose efflux permease
VSSTSQEHSLAQNSTSVELYSNTYRWYVVFILAFSHMFYTADKILLGVLVEPIKREFGASDSRMGLVSLVAAVSFAVCIIPMGLLADRVNRRNMLSIILAAWSLMTALSGFARNATQLALAQLCVGANESGSSPTITSLISDLFERRRRGLPVSIWYCGVSLGAFAGYGLGGYWGETYGWRTTFILLGIPGLVMALIIRTTVRETPRGMADGSISGPSRAPRFLETFSILRKQKALFHAVMAQCLSGAAFMGPIYWLTSYFVRTHGVSLTRAGSVIGLIFLTSGLLSAPVGGMIMDRLGQRDVRWHGWICALLMITGGVAMSGIYLLPTVVAAFVACFFWQLLTNAVSPINVTIISNLAPAQYRAVSNALGFLLFQLMGLGAGAQLVGLLSDAFTNYAHLASSDALRMACLSMVGFYGWAAVHFWIVGQHCREGYQSAARLER